MAAKTLLESVEGIINGASFAGIVRQSYGPVSIVEESECSSKATQALLGIQELLSNDGELSWDCGGTCCIRDEVKQALPQQC